MSIIESDIEKELNEIMLHSYPLELSERNRFLLLCEERGIPTVTNAITKKIASYCQDAVDKDLLSEPLRKDKHHTEYKIVVPEHFLDDIYDNFIEKLYCEIQLILFEEKSIYYQMLKNQNSGAYDHEVHSDKLVGLYGEEKLSNAKIQVRCFATKSNVYHPVYYTLIHEFNHCYEDYMRLLKGKETFNQWLNKTKYKENIRAMINAKDNNIANLCFILYNLSPTEVNAKVAQIYGEMSHRFYQNSIFACDAIKSTVVYNIMMKCYSYFEELNNITDRSEQDSLLTVFNDNSQKTFTSYASLLNYLENQLDIVKKTIFIKAAKNIDRINQEYLANTAKS